MTLSVGLLTTSVDRRILSSSGSTDGRRRNPPERFRPWTERDKRRASFRNHRRNMVKLLIA
jgi:hypothetical protein